MDAAATDPTPPAAPNADPASFPQEFWGFPPSQPLGQPLEQPFGIGWDHAVFHHSSPQHQQQSTELYAHSQPAWHPHTSLQTQQNYELQNQFRMTSYPERQQQPTSASYPPYTFETQNYYQTPLTTNGHFEQQVPVGLQRVSLQNDTGNTFESLAPAYSSQSVQPIQPRPVSFTDEFSAHPAPAPYHSTIDPQFLTAARQNQTRLPARDAFVVNPADLERSNTIRDFQAPNGQITKPAVLPNQHVDYLQARLHTEIHILPKSIQPRPKPKRSFKPRVVMESRPITRSRSESVSSSSDYQDEDDPPEQSPLPPSEPTDPDGKMKYDAMNIVWYPRNREPAVQQIRNAMVDFAELVKGVRDVWKSRSEALKSAENQNQEDKIPAIKREVIMQRRLMETIVNVTLDTGHPRYVQRFGEHPILLSALYSFLLDRHTAADSDGPLTVKILKLMTKFVTMDQDMLEKTKNDKILNRFVKKGGTEIKDLSSTVLANAAAATNAKSESEPEKPKVVSKQPTQVKVKKETPKSAFPQVVIQNPSLPTAGKRTREPEVNGVPPPKRVVPPVNGVPPPKRVVPLVNAKAGIKPPSAQAIKPSTAQAIKPRNGIDRKPAPQNAGQAAKPRANIVAPKPTPGLFSSLSASKKPGTSNAARAAAAAAAAKEKAKVEQQAPRPPPGSSHVFSNIMVDLNTPKEVVPAKPAEKRPPETEEQRAKRLRKEERRRLRVTWKPDDTLVQIKLYHLDPEEEVGGDESLKRDVDDVGGEGRTLKMHRELDDLDDEDDENLMPYNCPSKIDFTVLDAEDRARQFTKTGGDLAPKSPAMEEQDRMEANTLSVFYTSPEDVPISPKEPPVSEMEEESYEPTEDFGQPSDHVMARSARYFTAMAAYAARKAGISKPPSVSAAPRAEAPKAPAAPQVDIPALLNRLRQTPQLQQEPQEDFTVLENIFNQYRDPSQAPVQQTPTITGAAPALTLTPTPAVQPVDWQRLIDQMKLQATPVPDIGAVLAQLSDLQQQQASLPIGYGQQQASQPVGFGQQPAPGPYENPERKRYRESGGREEGDDGSHGHNKRFRANGEPGKPKKHPKSGLIPCRYWKEGKCLKGSDCTFRHDD